MRTVAGRDGPLSLSRYCGAPYSAPSSSLSLSLLNLLSATCSVFFLPGVVGTPAIVTTGSSAVASACASACCASVVEGARCSSRSPMAAMRARCLVRSSRIDRVIASSGLAAAANTCMERIFSKSSSVNRRCRFTPPAACTSTICPLRPFTAVTSFASSATLVTRDASLMRERGDGAIHIGWVGDTAAGEALVRATEVTKNHPLAWQRRG